MQEGRRQSEGSTLDRPMRHVPGPIGKNASFCLSRSGPAPGILRPRHTGSVDSETLGLMLIHP